MIDECWYFFFFFFLFFFLSHQRRCQYIIWLRHEMMADHTHSIYQSINLSINQYIHTVPHPSHRSCVTWILFWLICKVRLIFLPIQEECCFYIPVSILVLNKERKKRFCLESTNYSRDAHLSQLQLFKVFADRCLRVGRAPFC